MHLFCSCSLVFVSALWCFICDLGCPLNKLLHLLLFFSSRIHVDLDVLGKLNKQHLRWKSSITHVCCVDYLNKQDNSCILHLYDDAFSLIMMITDVYGLKAKIPVTS